MSSSRSARPRLPKQEVPEGHTPMSWLRELTIPPYMREIVAELTHLARKHPDISQRSGVSVRVSICNYENLLSSALKRAIRLGEAAACPRVSDLDAMDTAVRPQDDLLRHVATRLRAVTRAADMIARQSGDEFLVLVRDARGSRGDVAARPSGSRLTDARSSGE